CRLGHPHLHVSAVAAGGDLGLCRRAGAPGGSTMIVVLLNAYLLILFVLVKLKVIPFNLLWKLSPIIVLLVLLIGLFIPMNWGAPQGPALVVRNAVAIVPNVAGEVAEVPVTANAPLRRGDVLFRIDPLPYEAQLKALQAQLKLQSQRLSQMTELQTHG